MPSKTSFALIAILAASVSALPTRDNAYNDIFARGPNDAAVTTTGSTTTTAANAVTQPSVVAPALGAAGGVNDASVAKPVVHPHPHRRHPQQQQQQHPHPHPHRRHSTDANAAAHPHPHHRSNSEGGLSSLASQGNVNHHRGQHRVAHDLSAASVNPMQSTSGAGAGGAGAPVQAGAGQQQQTMTRREFYENPDLEARGLLETLGLKARVSNLTVKQTEQMTKAKTICGGLASKKDQHTCHKTVDKIIQMTKERNYDVEQFIKISNHHDVFTTSDPSLKSSSSSSSSS